MAKSIVVDANILLAALIRPEGWTAREVVRLANRLVLPQLAWEELQRHGAAAATKSGCEPAAWDARVQSMKTSLHTVPDKVIQPFLEHPAVHLAKSVDPDDAVYVACVQAMGAEWLWTRDKALHELFPEFAVPQIWF